MRTSCKKFASDSGIAQLPRRLNSENPLTRWDLFSIRSYCIGHFAACPCPAGPNQPTACLPYRPRSGRGGGIRTPTLGFGDRWSTVEPTPLNSGPGREGGGGGRGDLRQPYFTSLCRYASGTCCRTSAVSKWDRMLFAVLGGRVVAVFVIVALQCDDLSHGRLLDDLGDGSGADRVAAFADREAQPLLQGHRRNQT